MLPPYKIARGRTSTTIRDYTRRLGLALGVRGLMNVQYAIKDDVVYVLEVNPRASRTVPFVSKATGVPLAKVAARDHGGPHARRAGPHRATSRSTRIFVKESVFPFVKFPGDDILLGPEMQSTGEVMGISTDFGIAFAKAQLAAGYRIPTRARSSSRVNDNDKPGVLPHARALAEMGFQIVATRGTAAYLTRTASRPSTCYKVQRGPPERRRPDQERRDPRSCSTRRSGRESFFDDSAIRKSATLHDVLVVTTLTATAATVQAIRALRERTTDVLSIQEIHALARPGGRPAAWRA